MRRSALGLSTILNNLGADPNAGAEEQQNTLQSNLEKYRAEIIEGINLVPIEFAPRLIEEKSPFSAYLQIRDVIGTARTRIHYFDRYLHADFYTLYLRDIDRSIEIRLITTKGNMGSGVTNVIDVSRLAAGEFTDYQLIQCDHTELHDRNLRVDDKVFSLGPSAKDAGKHPMNFTPGDNSEDGHDILDKIIAKGTVVT